MRRPILLLLKALAINVIFAVAAVGEPRVIRVSQPASTSASAMHVTGRTLVLEDGSLRYQWPGLYFESAFEGRSIDFTVGRGEIILHVLIDGERVGTLTKPSAGRYRVDGLPGGHHLARVEVVTESQPGPNDFGGFAVTDGRSLPVTPRKRQIEFIGDSHTVGYGNTSTTRECTEADVWATTDNARAFGPIVARHFDADYRINAISGRGIVRNYNGFAADTLPQAYPFALLDHSAPANDAAWQPQIIVISLGTNDFSTPLHDGERWATRDALHADYEATYVRFVQQLRAAHPHAFFVLWATDMAEGEIQAEVLKVAEQLRAAGEERIAFVAVNNLAMTGCHWHPSVADDEVIAGRLAAFIDSKTQLWP
jgi:lysophospholipase L1-like esterase